MGEQRRTRDKLSQQAPPGDGPSAIFDHVISGRGGMYIMAQLNLKAPGCEIISLLVWTR